jgi:aspartyl/asparaginyl beta-hydroxylase (cupin superfamily)
MISTERKQAQALAAEGMVALARGDGLAARKALEGAIALGWPGAPVWVAVASAYRLLGDSASRRIALERALELAPTHAATLLAAGAFYEETSVPDRARTLYASALRVLGPRPPPAGLATQADRARAFLTANPDPLEQRIKTAFAPSQLGPSAEDRLFSLSLDILCGQTLPAYQQPTRYLYPGLPQRQFYERDEFGWAASLEARTHEITSELKALRTGDDRFAPYVEAQGREAGIKAHALRGNPDWSAFYVVKQGQRVEENIARCPATFAAIEALGEDARPAPAHSVLFSRLAPGAAIPPHHGQLNTRLICHLPLIIPERCGFRVGNDVREWRQGELLVFDDTIEHEAWNASSEERFVLIFEIWRPELSLRQRQLVTQLLAMIGGSSTPDA